MISALAIVCLTIIAIHNNIDTSLAIAASASAVAASNAYQRKPQESTNERKEQ